MGGHDVISWNALISAHAQSGDVWETFRCLNRMMVLDGESPNHITYVIILSVCNHAGLVGEGFAHFGALNGIHGIDYTQEHYACIVDMLCRVGLLPEAWELTRRMPFQPSSVIWMALLGGCRAFNELLLAIHAAQNVFELEPENSALYVLLSNICGMLLDLEDQDSVLDAAIHAELDRLYGRLEMGCLPSLIRLSGYACFDHGN
jgi:pentatricopeptide repeat protein